MSDPNVTLFLEGMILLFFQKADFSAGTAASCQVGILRDAPGHIYEIRVLKNEEEEPTIYEEEDIRFTLTLEVENPMSAINFEDWDEKFNRQSNEASLESFNWVLDLERDIYPNKPRGIGANRKQFRSVLHLDTGTFFTPTDGDGGSSGISLNDLLVCDEHCNPKKIIGKVATRVGVRITVDGDNKATFYNNQEVLFEAGVDDHYLVSIHRTRPRDTEGAAHHDHEAGAANAASHHDRDANNFYNAVGHGLAPAEKVFFVSTSLETDDPAGPEAACLVAMMGHSQI